MPLQKLLQRHLLLDALSSLIVWFLFMIFRRAISDFFPQFDLSIFIPYKDYYISFLIFPLLCLLIHYLSGYYVQVIKRSILLVFFKTLLCSLLISIIILFTLLLDDIVINYTYYYHAFWMLFGLLFFFTFSFRWIHIAHINKRFKQKKYTNYTLIIGCGNNAQKIATQLNKKSIYDTVVGLVCLGKQDLISERERGSVIGDFSEIAQLITTHNIQKVVVATEETEETEITDIFNRLLTFDVEILFTPKLYDIFTKGVHIERHTLHPLVSLTQPTIGDAELCIKRTADLLISLTALVLFTPLFVILGILIKRDSKGTIFYKQKRVGLHGKTFNIYKFRTMYVAAEKNRPQLSSPNDERITRIGRFLRKYRLDEIPQFINIIKGEMSIVGPRPERQYYINKIVQVAPYYLLLYRIKPGLTSWGPIKIGYADTIKKMVKRLDYDIIYMENMSLMTDIRILLSTIEVIFRGKGI